LKVGKVIAIKSVCSFLVQPVYGLRIRGSRQPTASEKKTIAKLPNRISRYASSYPLLLAVTALKRPPVYHSAILHRYTSKNRTLELSTTV